VSAPPPSGPTGGAPAAGARALAPYALAMGALVAASNLLVQRPINEFLTWAVFSFPFTFVVLDLANRARGPAFAARVTAVGFAVGLPLSLALGSGARIAAASLTAYLAGQALDIALFHRLRARGPAGAHLLSSVPAAALDGLIFFSLAFAGTGVAWPLLCAGDTSVKIMVVVAGTPLFGALARRGEAARAGSP